MKNITSLQNPEIKEALKLWKHSERDDSKLFLIEGYRETRRALDSKVLFSKLFICKDFFLGSNEPELIEDAQKAGAELIFCDKNVFAKLSYRDRPDGILAIAHQMKKRDLKELLGIKNPFFLVAESIEKPGNLGTIMRSCDASGVNGLIICDKCTDIYNPNVVRASVGTLFSLPIFEGGKNEVFSLLKENGIKIISTTPSASGIYTKTDLSGPVAIVVGTEQLGLSPIWMEGADIKIKIPMLGIADSLNVATATTLVLYEVLRQR